jgi:hypothetical protein
MLGKSLLDGKCNCNFGSILEIDDGPRDKTGKDP